ncbi:AsmA family protein [Vitreimonas flagellata]|uniref:AsmA family protein n=1 Tax=Vitreimonas flagellata TaxID=2560861 RepID=UPI0014305353|nr:AsmA family protein [Vitreimonas flagellata]
MSFNFFTTRLKARANATGAWLKRAGARVGEGVSSEPWPRIGIWAGGIVAAFALTLVLFLTFADWNALRGPISRFASAATGRQIIIGGNLDVNPWSWTPEADVQGLRIGNPARFHERGAFAEVQNAEVSVRLLPLFIGRFDIVRLDLDGAHVALYRSAEGDSNWSAGPNAGRGRQFNLPAIREFALRNGRVQFEDDKRNMVLDATFTTQESADASNPGSFELNGEGRINRRPFTIALSGAPLLNVRRDRPYNFVAEVHAGATHIEANGAINRPFDFGVWGADIRARGSDLADLYPLIGLALPNTPPYNLTGRVERNGQRYGMPNVQGRVGDSDLRGAFTATRQRNGRLLLDGDFQSNSLDFDDLLAVLGGAPSTRETASPEQQAIAAQLAAQGRILPDARLDISRVRNMDARVSYRAARVRSDRFPLRGLFVDVSIDEGLLLLDPLQLELSRGRLGGAISINARHETPRVDMDVRLTNTRIESIIALSGQPPVTGPLSGRAQFSGSGASVRDAAANANGNIVLVTQGGEVREAFAELTGINVTRGLGLLLSDDDSTTNVRCGVVSFRVQNGIARTRTLVVDTKDVLIGGEGQISLRDETMSVRIQGEPKEPRLVRLEAPITIEGSLRAPRVGVEAEGALGQGGVAALLGSLVAPLAAVLPFVDAGLAEDANCGALLAGRQEQRTREEG